MKSHFEYPLLRHPVDVRLVTQAEGEILVLTCPMQLSPQPLALMSGVGPVLAECNGKRSFKQILSSFTEHGLTQKRLIELLDLLDEYRFLHSPEFELIYHNEIESFRVSPIRQAALAGLSYPAQADTLRSAIDAWWHSSPTKKFDSGEKTSPLTLLKSPHIDYERGHRGYTAAYRELQPGDHDLLIVAGTAHQYSPHLFHCTTKHFDSPLGTAQCDVEFANELCRLYGKDRALADEYLHKREHSLELQMPFLKYTGSETPMVPILVGSFHSFLLEERQPEHYEAYDAFASALTTLIEQRTSQGLRVGLLAGVDMAHVGKFFGDTFTLTPRVADLIAARDQIYLDCISKSSKNDLFAHVAEDEDTRRICGFPTMYLLLDVIERLGLKTTPKQFAYHQALSTEQQCLVSFAAMGLYDSAPTAGSA
jgi:MEMO1 family protein